MEKQRKKMTLKLSPIGTIESPFKELKGMPIQPTGAGDAEGRILLDETFVEGLSDLEGFSHIILLYWFHRSKGYALKVKPFMDDEFRGLFATRAPRRPNPIGLSVVRLLGIEHNVLHIRGVDVVDGTPLLDIKPYVPKFDAVETVSTGWLEKNAQKSTTIRSDDRFVDGEE